MTSRYVYAILVAGWALWVVPFFLVNSQKQPAKQIDKRARWGIVIVAVAYSLLWQGKFWQRFPRPWQIATSILFFLLAGLLSWTASRALGRQWRMDAALREDHELVTAGPYRIVRHPIYTSMFCMMLGTGFLVTPWWLFMPAIVVFVIGTEIRVRVEDKLLAGQFGTKFDAYKNKVPAYAPFLR